MYYLFKFNYIYVLLVLINSIYTLHQCNYVMLSRLIFDNYSKKCKVLRVKHKENQNANCPFFMQIF